MSEQEIPDQDEELSSMAEGNSSVHNTNNYVFDNNDNPVNTSEKYLHDENKSDNLDQSYKQNSFLTLLSETHPGMSADSTTTTTQYQIPEVDKNIKSNKNENVQVDDYESICAEKDSSLPRSFEISNVKSDEIIDTSGPRELSIPPLYPVKHKLSPKLSIVQENENEVSNEYQSEDVLDITSIEQPNIYDKMPSKYDFCEKIDFDKYSDESFSKDEESSLLEIYSHDMQGTRNSGCENNPSEMWSPKETTDYDNSESTPSNLSAGYDYLQHDTQNIKNRNKDGIFDLDFLNDFSSKRNAESSAWSECNSVCGTPRRSEVNYLSRHSERRRSLQMPRRFSMTEFDRKPWNYGAGGSQYHNSPNRDWVSRRSVCGSTISMMDRSTFSEQGHGRRFDERRRSLQMPRRISLSELEKKPWNYGAGGSQYQKHYPFGKNKRNSVV